LRFLAFAFRKIGIYRVVRKCLWMCIFVRKCVFIASSEKNFEQNNLWLYEAIFWRFVLNETKIKDVFDATDWGKGPLH